MGWGEILLSLGNTAFQTYAGMKTASNAQNAVQDATQQQAAVYQPYNRLGLAAGSTLAGLLGIDPALYNGQAPPEGSLGAVLGNAVPRTTPLPVEPVRDRGHQSAPLQGNPADVSAVTAPILAERKRRQTMSSYGGGQ